MGESVSHTVFAPAKINLCLHVLSRRADGYHDLAMIMQRVSLYDRIDLCLRSDSEVRVSCAGLELAPGEENLAARAARRVLRLAGARCGVDIVIEKQIPVAAGLGGGSSDAAAVMAGLNDMLGLGWGERVLMAEGLALGADVPFFHYGKTAWATGVGEVLEDFEVGVSVWYVLVNPGVSVSTASVFADFALTSPGGIAKMPGFPRTVTELCALFHNDLEKVTIARHPLLGSIKERLVAAGAVGALMSGSGPTVFGAFADEGSARRAAGCFSAEGGWRVFVVQPV